MEYKKKPLSPPHIEKVRAKERERAREQEWEWVRVREFSYLYHLFNVSAILSQYQFLTASAWHINFYVSECARAHFQYQTRAHLTHNTQFSCCFSVLVPISNTNDCINTGPFQINVPIWIHENWHSWNFSHRIRRRKKKPTNTMQERTKPTRV